MNVIRKGKYPNIMFCPSCGVENAGETSRFCRSCGADLRAISRAMGKSLPVKLANTLDAYLENRFQRNFGNGVLNLLAFVALVIVGSGYLVSGWTRSGVFMVGLGIWKFLGVVAVLIPKFPLLKEWAYAGFFFVMSGAIFSHIALGDPMKEIFPSLLLLILTVVSWYFRPEDRKIISVNR
jgi:hypothetical protein